MCALAHDGLQVRSVQGLSADRKADCGRDKPVYPFSPRFNLGYSESGWGSGSGSGTISGPTGSVGVIGSSGTAGVAGSAGWLGTVGASGTAGVTGSAG